MYLFIKKCSNKKSIWQTQQQHRDKLKRTSITEKNNNKSSNIKESFKSFEQDV